MKQTKLIFVIFNILLWYNSVFAQEKKIDVSYIITAEEASKPFQFKDTEGKEIGVITDIIHAVFDHSDYNLKTETLPPMRFANEIERMKQKKPTKLSRFVTYGSTDWFPKNSVYQFSKHTLLSMNSVIISNAENNFQFHQVSDLFGKTITLIHGFDYPGLDQYLKTKGGKINVQPVKTPYQALQSVLDKSRDTVGFVEFEDRIKYVIRDHKFKESAFKFTDISDIIKPVPIAFVFSNDFTPKEISTIDARIEMLIQNKTIEKIIKKYK